ncbi:uncharacterized protein LOC133175830 [Saccostrea echinata]|uniref:uncharacterized protein LOC133175830 n=1 Tax=Saccostrea echinata TaxID=191078 RepID=UPI002A833752|nr:uncharacterized protein LOC133175830 [Saccostrea echinata]
MQVATVENIILAIVLFTMTGAAQRRPRRRFCEVYPFARRCLGVAAKRDVSANMNTEKSRELKLLELKDLLERERFTEKTDSRRSMESPENDVLIKALSRILNNKRTSGSKYQDKVFLQFDGFSQSNDDYPVEF